VAKESEKERKKQKAEGKKDGGEYSFLASLVRDATPPASPVMSAMEATAAVPAMPAMPAALDEGGEEQEEGAPQTQGGKKRKNKVDSLRIA
jgi:hypothetical protein